MSDPASDLLTHESLKAVRRIVAATGQHNVMRPPKGERDRTSQQHLALVLVCV